MTDGSRTSATDRSRGLRARGLRAWTVIRALAVTCIAFDAGFTGCGGTTGHEDLPPLSNPTSSAEAADATVSDDVDDTDAGEFDATVMYTDRVLPEIQAPPSTGGGDAAPTFPVCPADIPANIEQDGGITPLIDGSIGNYEVAAVFIDDGGEAPAPDGSACESQVYLGSPECDECMRLAGGNYWSGQFNPGGSPQAVLPPCSDLWEAGTISAGYGAGETRYRACVNLYTCIQASQCLSTNRMIGLNPCLCTLQPFSACADAGIPAGFNGPCGQEELAALEATNESQFIGLVEQLTDCSSTVGEAAGCLNGMLQFMIVNCAASCGSWFEGGQDAN